MPHVLKLINLFEGLSGKPARPVQTTVRRPAQYGISAENKPSLSKQKQDNVSQPGVSNISSILSTVYAGMQSSFKRDIQPQSTMSENFESSAKGQTDVQGLEHKTKGDLDNTDSVCTEKPSDRTRLSNESVMYKAADREIGGTSDLDKRQLLGSSKNIAFLVGDAKMKSNAAVGKMQKTRLCQDDHIGTGKETNVQLGNSLEDTSTVCQLPRFSLFDNESSTGSLPGPEATDCIAYKSASTNFEVNHDDNKHDQRHDVNETKVRYTKQKSTGTSRTSGIFSGSNPTVNDADSILSQEDQRVEHQARSTERYVEETFASRKLMSRMKYPSEPTNIQTLPLRSRTLTQENVVNIKDSNVSIYSGEESMAASQFSVMSWEQETRESIAEQTKELLTAHAIDMKVPEQRRLKKAMKVLEEEGVVFIVDNKGSGSTHLAWDLLLGDNSVEKFNLLELNNFEMLFRSKGPIAILVDDILDESTVDICLKYIKVGKKKYRSSRSIKLIFTVKHHIFNGCKIKLNDYKKCIVDLEDPKIQLDSDEMTGIMKAMIENNRDELKVVLDNENRQHMLKRKRNRWTQISAKLLTQIAGNALPSGFPKNFKQFLETKGNIKQGLAYFTQPTEDLVDDVTSDLEKHLTLVMTTVFGGKLTLEKIRSVNKNQHQTVAKSKGESGDLTKQSVELLWWIEIIRYYAKRCTNSLLESALSGLHSLKGNYLREEIKGIYSFAAPCVKNAVLISLGRDFPQHVLKLCDLPFFQYYVGSDNCFAIDDNNCVRIDVMNKDVCSSANEMLLKLADRGEIELFAKHKLLRDQQFLRQFFDSIGKDTEQLWKISKACDINSGRCAVYCALETEYFLSSHTPTSNFAYSILLHKVWGQKRKVYKEWTGQMEKEVLYHYCKRGHEEIYFELRRKYNIPVDIDCLQGAVVSGSYIIVDDILQLIGKDISDNGKCKCIELALLKYTRNPLKSRHDVVNALLKFVSVDYKINGIDPIIHAATKTGDARVIVTLEVFDGDINVTNFEGKTCLHEAIKRNKAAFLLMALQHGADQRKSDKSGVLPIHEAARQNKPYIMRLLMEKDRDIVIATDRSGRQPLHYAAIYNSVGAANSLLEHDVEVDAYDFEQSTPLHHAAASGKASVMHSLLKAKADIRKTDKDGNSPLLIACKTGNVKGVKRLLQDISQTELDSSQNECLFVALKRNQREIIKMLCDKGLNNADLVQFLIKKKADVNMPCDGSEDMFPVHVAASGGGRNLFEALVDAGANIDEVTLDNNDTVLHIATENGNDELVYYILQTTDNLIGCRNKQGEVPLHIAARNGNLPVTRALLARDAEKSPINKRFQKPLCLVEDKLDQLHRQRDKDEYSNYYSVMMLLKGHRVMLETAL